MVVVVLGTHRSGTSLVAAILRKMGVNMGERFPNTTHHNRWGYWEDVEFLRMNIQLLRKAGGKWSKVPDSQRVLAAGKSLAEQVEELIGRKSVKQGKRGYRWGWKDPRTCLTIPVYHPYLVEPRYIIVERKRTAIIRSLMTRHRGSPRRKWAALTDAYLQSVEDFLKSVDSPHYRIQFEDLLDKRKARDEVIKLGWFLGMKRFKMRLIRGVAQIRFGD